MEKTVRPVITLTADLGDQFARGQVELIVHAINPDVKFIIASNQVTPYSVTEGAFILSKFYQFSPKGSVHIGVVDPGVGSKRRGLIIQTKHHYFIGPDNGLLYEAAKNDGIKKVWVINEHKIGGSVSNTFHGRDVFAKTAALISLKKPINQIATSTCNDSIQKLTFNNNEVLHIDPYGNIKINRKVNDLKIGDDLKILLSDREIIIPFCKKFCDVKKGQLLVYEGSHQTLELAVNLGSAAKRLQVKVGEIIDLYYCQRRGSVDKIQVCNGL